MILRRECRHAKWHTELLHFFRANQKHDRASPSGKSPPYPCMSMSARAPTHTPAAPSAPAAALATRL
eukprot:scaffold167686_cov13-Tisochrysis_lutea.AAC.1